MHFLMKKLGFLSAQPKTELQPLTLIFRGVVQDGEGSFNKMVFPGRNQLSGAPNDWPVTLQPGSMNCKVIAFPANFEEVAGPGDRKEKLDHAVFGPAFSIPHNAIENNSLSPQGSNRRIGMAQAWRCAITNEGNGEQFDAWHVRRVDGSYKPYHGIIELMADRKLRVAHDLTNGTVLSIAMQGFVRP